jgi:uncharacterized protein (TIGR02757 family)
MTALIRGVGDALGRYGSLEACFLEGCGAAGRDLLDPLARFVGELTGGERSSRGGLLPNPEGGSACKRLNLYLRWMIRSDRVDPGVWKGIPASKLLIPLDTHMHRLGRMLGFTARKNADLAAMRDVTGAFREIAPDDPVRYDFSLTHAAIRSRGDRGELLRVLGLEEAMTGATPGSRGTNRPEVC